VDPVIPEVLWVLQEDNSTGWQPSDPIVGEEVPMINAPISRAVRQIGHELQLSLEAGEALPKEILSRAQDGGARVARCRLRLRPDPPASVLLLK
jgi:hypothetical protein